MMMARKIVYLALFAIVFLCGAARADSDDEADNLFSVSLNEENFDAEVAKKNHFVMFYAPWCSHCQRLHPLWEELAELMNVKEDQKVVIARVNCIEQQALCAKNSVTGYPTLRFFKLGETESIKFKGTRDMPAITEFINAQLSDEHDKDAIIINKEEKDVEAPTRIAGQPIELTEENFAKHVSSGNHFVKFYAPWCTHCQRLAPTWDALAKSLADETSVSIGKIDCTQYRPICQDFEVRGYPTLLWIEDGKKIEKFSGTRDQEALKGYVIKMLGAETKQTEDDKPKEGADNTKHEVIQLIEEEFEKSIAEGITFVKFYAPWCGHCQKLSPTWDQLAKKFHSDGSGIKIAKVDCTVPGNKNLCVDQQVEGYPTLFAYKNGEKQTEYDGGRSLPELQNYISKFIGHDEL